MKSHVVLRLQGASVDDMVELDSRMYTAAYSRAMAVCYCVPGVIQSSFSLKLPRYIFIVFGKSSVVSSS